MDPFYILAIFITTVIFIILPLTLIGLFYLVLKKKSSRKLSVVICSILLTIFVYSVFTSFYPREKFYLDNFEENTELNLPNSARLVNHEGNNSIYQFGGYNISYIYELPTNDYEKLYSQLVLKGFKQSSNYLETIENDKLLSANPTLKTNKILTKDFGFKNFDIIFLEDKKTIIFNSNQW
jgi:hypothetical protein